jgi:hypothetical protein
MESGLTLCFRLLGEQNLMQYLEFRTKHFALKISKYGRAEVVYQVLNS